mmetsp:Transcript_37955/g.82533  ORF Transcript_37955/g.82533 Transcript_37955/m.82533 type:complete len:332 (-) Transcript_37955:623-1618(-)
MTLVSLQILRVVRSGALVNVTLLCAHDKQVVALLVEVEAAATSEAAQGSIVIGAILGATHKLQLHDVLVGQFALAHGPQRNTAIAGNTVKVELLCVFLGFLLPVHLPDGVCVLAGLDARGENRTVDLVANVENHDGTIIQPHGKQRGVLGMEVQGHDPGVSGEGVLRVRGVFQRVAADESSALLHEVKAAVANSEQIVVLRIPADGSDMLALSPLVVELPQWQQRALALTELIRCVLPILEVVGDIAEGVLIDHALHHLHSLAHTRTMHNALLRLDRLSVLFLHLALILVLYLLHLLLHGLPVLILHVGIIHLPLRARSIEDICGWRLGSG